ncbi:integral membrane protein, partial [Apodospora peruviana]
VLPAAATGVVAAIHTYIMYLEMYLWTKPTGRKTFGLTAEYAEQTKALAQSQGLYNGFLAAGLTWGVLHPVPEFASQLRLFFLGCVVVAGVFGAATANKRILYVQALPAA